MRIYVHDHEGMDVVDADRADTLADVLGDPSVLWAEDADEPLDTGAAVGSATERPPTSTRATV